MQLPLGTPYAIGSCQGECECRSLSVCVCVSVCVCKFLYGAIATTDLHLLLICLAFWVCNECATIATLIFPFQCLSPPPPPFAFPSPLQTLCMSVRLLPVCLVLIPQRVCLLLLLLPSILHQTRVCRAVYPVCLPLQIPPLPSASYAFVYLAYLLPVHGCNFWATKSLMQNACSTHDELVETLGRQLLEEKKQEGAAVGEGGGANFVL